MHQNLAVILQQFNYSKISFIVLVPGRLVWGRAGVDLGVEDHALGADLKVGFAWNRFVLNYLYLRKCLSTLRLKNPFLT